MAINPLTGEEEPDGTPEMGTPQPGIDPAAMAAADTGVETGEDGADPEATTPVPNDATPAEAQSVPIEETPEFNDPLAAQNAELDAIKQKNDAIAAENERSFDLDDEDIGTTWVALKERIEKSKDPEAEVDPTLEDDKSSFLKLAYHGAVNNDFNMAIRYQADKLAHEINKPDWWDKRDPDYVPSLEDLKDIPSEYRDTVMTAYNAEHFEYLKAHVMKAASRDADWKNSNWDAYLPALGIHLGAEAATVAIATMGLSAVSGGGGFLVAGAQGAKWAKRIVNSAGHFQAMFYRAGLGARGSYIAGKAVEGLTMNIVEAGLVYDAGMVQAKETLIYPLTGIAFGAATGVAVQGAKYYRGLTPDSALFGKGKTYLETGKVSIDPDARMGEQLNVAAARVQRAERLAGAKPDLEAQPKVVDPMPNHKKALDADDVNGDAKLSGEADSPNAWKNDNVRATVFEEDVKLRVREKGKHEIAMKAQKTDSVNHIGPAFRGGKTRHLTPKKQAAELGEAFERQAYRNEKTRRVFTVVGKNADEFAGNTGKGVRVGYDNLADAKAELVDGARVVAVEIGPGARIIEGEDLGEGVGAVGQVMFGDGKIGKQIGTGGKKGKALSIDGEVIQKMGFRPSKDMKNGTPGLLSGVFPDGRPLGEGDILKHNQLMDQMDPEVATINMREGGSSVGALQFAKAQPLTIPMEQYAEGFARRASDPTNITSVGDMLSRIANIRNSASNFVKKHSMRVLGDAATAEQGGYEAAGASWSGKKQMWDESGAAELNEAFAAARRAFNDEMKQLKRDLPWGEIQNRNLFQEMHHEYISHVAMGRKVPDEVNLKAFQDYQKASDKFYKDQLGWLQDPGSRVGEPGTYLPVAGSEDIVFKNGHFSQVIDTGYWGRMREEVGPNVLSDVWTGAIEGWMARTGRQVDKKAARAIGDLFQISRAQRGSVGVDFLNNNILSLGSPDKVMKALDLIDHGLSDKQLKDLSDALNKIIGDTAGSTKDLTKRLQIDITTPVQVQRWKDGQPAGFVELRPMDFFNKNHHQNMKRYMETHNGWQAGATTRFADDAGNDVMVKVKDPKNPDGEMLEYPKTVRSMKEFNEMKQIPRDELDNKGIKESSFGKESDPSQRSNAGLDDMTSLATWERSLDYLINRSGENPHDVAQVGRAISTIYNMGNGWRSSAYEVGSSIAWTQGRAIGRLLERFIPDLRGMVGPIAKGLKDGSIQPEDLMDFRRRMQSLGLGVKTQMLQGGHSLDTGSRSYSFGDLPESNSWGDRIKYELARGSNLILNYGGSTRVQDVLQTDGALGMADRMTSWFRKWKSFDKMPQKYRRMLESTNIPREDLDRMVRMMADPDVVGTSGTLFEMVNKINQKSPKFNQRDYFNFEYALRHIVTNRVIMDQKYGAMVPGSAKGVFGPIASSLQTFVIGSFEQQMKPMLKEMWHDTKGAVREGSKMNFTGADGALQHASSFAGNGIMAVTSGAGAYAVYLLSTSLMNWDKGEEWQEEFWGKALDIDKIVTHSIDKSGVLSFVPMAYNNAYAPLMGAAGMEIDDWTGFSREGNVFNENVFDGSVAGWYKGVGKAYDAAVDIAANPEKATDKKIKRIGKILPNFYGVQQGVSAIAEGLEAAGVVGHEAEWNPMQMDGPVEQHKKLINPPKKAKPDILDYDKLRKVKRKKNWKKIRSKLGDALGLGD